MATNKSNKRTNQSGKSTKKQSNKNKVGARLVVSIIILTILAGGFFVGLSYEDKIDESLGLRKVETFVAGDKVSIGALNIHFIDVGQGDACLVELPDNRVMLIDAGENTAAVENKLKNYINEVNETRAASNPSRPEIEFFDYAVITHSDSDHTGSMDYILNLYHAAVFYRPNEDSSGADYVDPAADPLLSGTKHGLWGAKQGTKPTAVYRKALEAGYQPHDNFKEAIVTNPHDNSQNCIKPNLSTSHELYYEVNFYGPVKPDYSKANDHSPIIIIEYKGRRIALSGDAQSGGENDFVNAVQNAQSDDRYYALKNEISQTSYYVDIIKMGHHGSDTSSTQAYLSLLTKSQLAENTYIVISVNEIAAAKNDWTHPHPTAMARVKAAGIPDDNILRTDQNGDIFFAFVLYEGESCAHINTNKPTISYPILGGVIRYRNIGIAVLVVLALILLPASMMKKAKKQMGKTK